MLYICTQHNTVFLYCPKNDNVFRGIFSAFPLIVVGEVDLRYFTHKSRYDCARMALGRWRLSSVLGLLHRSDLLFFGRRCTYSHSTHSSFIFFLHTDIFFFFFFNAVWLLQTGQIRRQSSQLQRGSDQTWGQRRECGLAKPRKEILGDALAWQRTLFLTVHHILAECKYQDKIFICTFFFSSNFLLQGLLNANRDIGRNGVQWRVLHYFWSFVFVHFVFSSFGVGWREKVREFIDFLLLPFLYLFTQGVLSVTHYTRPKSHVMPTRVTSKLSPTMILS